jgi:hypothetical protein
MLSRAEAMCSERAREAFSVSDAVWLNDPRLREALEVKFRARE